MEDKDMKKLISENKKEILNNMKSYLELEEEVFFNENIPEIDEDSKKIIRSKTYEKIENLQSRVKEDENRNKKYDYKKLASVAATLLVVVILGSSTVMAIIDKMYSYIPGQGSVVQSGGNVYIVDEPITKVVGENTITLENITIDEGNKRIYSRIEGSGTKPIDQSIIKIGESNIKLDNMSIGSGAETWTASYWVLGEFKYNQGDDVRYEITLENGEKVDFVMKLSQTKSVSNFSELGPTDTKEKISITAIVKEKENILDVNFLSAVEGGNSDIMYYGKEFADEYESGVILKDANGKIVKGKQIHHGDRANHFEFNIKGLTKPFKIEIPKVVVNFYGSMGEAEVIKLDLPKDGSVDINKEVKLTGPNENLISRNNTVKISSIKKKEDNSYDVRIDFPQNKNNKIKIAGLNIDPKRWNGIFGFKSDFSGWGTTISEYGIQEDINIMPDNEKKDSISFKLYPGDYIVEGSWSIEINE